MTDQDLAAIEARAQAATPGPLEAMHHSDSFDPGYAMPPAIFDVAGDEVVASWGLTDADVDFFAAARADVLALVAEIRRVRAGIADLPISHDELCTVLTDWRTPPADRRCTCAAATLRAQIAALLAETDAGP